MSYCRDRQGFFGMAKVQDIDVRPSLVNSALRLVAYAVGEDGWDVIMHWDLRIDDHFGVLDSLC